ncbi:MAG: glucose-phosphate thymidylyltransferase [Segetibacter sp.]|nr:glucose-phosphate thymidylyltransferase [Segetibacter sp.]
MKILLFDTPLRKRLFPLTLTRAVAELRFGILTIKEWWQLKTGMEVFIFTDTYLQALYEQLTEGDYLIVDACILANPNVYEKIIGLKEGEAFADKEGIVAGRINIESFPTFQDGFNSLFQNPSPIHVNRVDFPCEIFHLNQEAIRINFELVTEGRSSQPLSATNQVINPEDVFIEEGASVECSILNASTGPIYIGKDATIMEGCMVRGPFALCEGAVLKMGTKVYSGTTLGPYCVGGGEIKNSVMMGYSNKAHEGYLGDSIIGEWCNLGAGTSNSNVKNTGGKIKVWNYYKHEYVPSGTKCGLIMGDYSRTAINSSINTGTLIGICCNVFGEGLTPKFIPDFTWGTKGLTKYEFDKAVQDILNWKRMKNKTLDERKLKVLKHIFDNYTG